MAMPPAAASGGTSGSAGTQPAQTSRDAGDFFESGAWRGYVFVSAQGMGSTISPMDFSMQTTGMPRCVMGSVAASADYSAIAQLGFELTDMGGGVTPTQSGVLVEVENTAASPLRFQVESPDGTTRWCAQISGSGGFIPWTSLNTMCWDNSGVAYNNEPIAKAMFLVPGAMTAAVPFDFCVNKLAEADGPAAGAAGSGGSSAGTGGAPSSMGGSGGSGGNGGNSSGSAGQSGGNTTVPPLEGGCMGYATRYWDCCKPHCGWSANVPGGASPLNACDMSDNSLGGNVDARNSCEAGGTAYLCHNMVPWAVNDQLSYGFSAVAASSGDICGKCYQLQFSGVSFNAGEDPGSTALRGKQMIVQAINVGGDVGSGQFDLSVPGGGVGIYNACSAQWGVPASELGGQYGGFLQRCKEQVSRTDHAALKSCVMQSCMNIFETRGLTELAAGCRWFVDWFEVADNPAISYKEVSCPEELGGKGVRRPGGPGNSCL